MTAFQTTQETFLDYLKQEVNDCEALMNNQLIELMVGFSRDSTNKNSED